MHVLSFSHTIVAEADKAVLRKGEAAIKGGPPVYHPVGTVLDLENDLARELIEFGAVERYDPKVHGDDPALRGGRPSMVSRPADPPAMRRAAA